MPFIKFFLPTCGIKVSCYDYFESVSTNIKKAQQFSTSIHFNQLILLPVRHKKMFRSRIWARNLLLITVISCIVALGFDKRNDTDFTDGEGIVEQYLMARQEAEHELEEFYETATPGDEPDWKSEAMENLRFNRERLYQAGLSAKDVDDLIEGDPGMSMARTVGQNSRRKCRSTRKRTIEIKPSRRWTKAIVPFVFIETTSEAGQTEIIRSMRTYERFTCLRYVPWSEADALTTNK